ncbi:thiamine pyrophosphate-binding protein, partial [Acidobacteria bacterium AH-259-G07]|nr:thiamine pyrophosphate-binding protein [Acidobacteria bacterium AH-259-G07]
MLQAKRILTELKRLDVSHVVGIPDNSSAALFDLLHRDGEIQLVKVTQESEAFAIAAGVWIGGKTPVVLIQNTGFLGTGDSFRGTVMRMRIPLLCFITYRGYTKMVARRLDPNSTTLDAELLSDSGLDSAALITESTLKAWGVPYYSLDQDDEVSKVSLAFAQAKALS